MPSSHHRKKHKHFQPPPHINKQKKKGGVTSLLAIVGAVLGTAITYFANPENILLIIGGLVVGISLGYYIGYRIDKSDTKK